MITAGKFAAGRMGMPGIVFCAIFSLAVAGCGEDESAREEREPDTAMVSDTPVQGPNTGGTSVTDTVPAQTPAKDTATAKPSQGPDQQKIKTEYIASRRHLIDVLIGIHTESDLRRAAPAMTAAYGEVAQVLRKYRNNPSALKTAHTGPEVKALDQQLAAHLQRLAANDPNALRAITNAMRKQGASLAQLENSVLKEAVDD